MEQHGNSAIHLSGCGSVWLERCVRDAEAGGSNPLTPTICSVYGILDTTFGPAEIPFFLFPSKRQSKKSVSGCNGRRILRIQKKFRFSAIVRKLPDYQKFEPGFYIPVSPKLRSKSLGERLCSLRCGRIEL